MGVILISQQGYSQVLEFMGKSSQAREYLRNEEFKQAKTLYSSILYGPYFGVPEEYRSKVQYEYAQCLGKLNQIDSAIHSLKQIPYDHINLSNMESDPAFSEFGSSKSWKKLKKEICHYQAKLESSTNYELVSRISLLDSLDQVHRNHLRSVLNAHGVNSPAYDSLVALMTTQDSLNSIEVEDILEEYGWPSKFQIGREGQSTLFFVIQHASIETQEKYLPLILRAYQEGEAKGEYVALLTDRIAGAKGKKQTYGTQVAMDKEKGVMYVLPIEDTEKINEKRADLDLQPIEEYLASFGIEWP